MRGHADALEVLRDSRHFAALNDAALKSVTRDGQSKSLRSGEILFTEGDPCRHLYILVAGQIKCYRVSADGREQILNVFERPGDTFCIASAFSTRTHIVTARTMQPTALHVLDLGTILRVAQEQPAFAVALTTAAAGHLKTLVGLADDLALKTATARVAKLLRDRARVERVETGTEVALLREGLREEEIASRVGTVRVHVSRSLKRLADAGVIRLNRRTIHIIDFAALEKLAEGP